MSTLTGTRTHSTSHSPPSLPSFAQAFPNLNHAGVSTLAKISLEGDQAKSMDTLPPIHTVDKLDPDRKTTSTTDARKGKKRVLEHDDGRDEPDAAVEPSQKRSVDRELKRASTAVKRESSPSPSPDVSHMELDQLDPSPSPPRRPAKKRRVASGPLPKSQPSVDRDSPGSPVVASFQPPSSDQGAMEQVRAMLSIKAKQKELIDQRRGSAAGLLQTTPPTAASPRPGPPARRPSALNSTGASAATSSQQQRSPPHHPSQSPQQQHAQPASQHQAPPHHFSPPQHALPMSNNSFSNSRRRRGTLQNGNGHTHSLAVESTHPLAQPPRLPAPIVTSSASAPHAFPQPPPPQSQGARTPAIAKSTTTRAAPPKPLTIAPLAHSRRLEPLVHSAPVIGGFGPVRVPELPPIPITPGGRRISAQGGGGASVAIAKSGGMRTAGLGLGLGRVSIASGSGVGTVPPTPAYASLATQQQPPAQDGKAGFLQLFENFYDSLADSRLLKQWLQEQLAKSNALLEQLGKVEKEREKGSGVTLAQVEELVERRVAPMRNEVEGLRRRVGELEEMLYRERQRSGPGPRRESYPEFEDDGSAKSGLRMSRASDAGGYVFPERREDSERDPARESPGASHHSSPSFDQRRLSTSAVRLESGPAHPHPHPHFPLPTSQHRPSPLGLERERDSRRAWERERRRPVEGGASNGATRHDAERERERERVPSQTKAPSA